MLPHEKPDDFWAHEFSGDTAEEERLRRTPLPWWFWLGAAAILCVLVAVIMVLSSSTPRR